MIWDEIKKEIRAGNASDIEIGYHAYDYFTCKLKRYYHKKYPIAVCGSSPEDAFEKAKVLTEKVEKLEQETGKLLKVDSDEKPLVGRYIYQKYGDDEVKTEVTFKTLAAAEACTDKLGVTYEVIGICKVDEFDYTVSDVPYAVKESVVELHPVSLKCRMAEYAEQHRKVLKQGEELWYWYDIRMMSGTAGFAVVKDGMVLRTKGILIA